MARKPTPTTELVETPDLNEQKIAEIGNAGAILASAASEEYAVVNQLLGQAQMADSISKFSRTVRLTKLAYVKENRLYRALSGHKTPNGSALKGTWEEFCGLLGYSKDKVDLDLQNLRAFGEDALESMSRMGIGYREMRQFRKLPDDSKQALMEVAKTGDKDAFVELAEEIISKHTKERESLEKELSEVKADYEARGERLHKKNEELEAAQFALQRAERRLKDATPDEAEKQIKLEVSGVTVEIQSLFRTRLNAALETLTEHSQETGSDQRLYMATLVKQMELELIALREKYDLPADLDADDTDWMSEAALAEAEAAITRSQEH